jgi:hypothetical protein
MFLSGFILIVFLHDAIRWQVFQVSQHLLEILREGAGYCDPDPHEYKPARQNYKLESYQSM